MSFIFVSYRRTDVPGHAGRLYDRLVDRFGKANVFMDVDSMEPGADFVEAIEETVGRCDALFAVIGPGWLGTEQGAVRRLDDPQDFVRLEILNALERGIRVVPVLVHGASMPSPSDLPEELQQFARRHGFHLTETAWRAQLDQLIDDLENALQRRPSVHAPEPREAGPAEAAAPDDGTRTPERAPWDWSAGVRQVLQIEHPRRGFLGVLGVEDRQVHFALFSTDGRRIATASDDKTARVWEADSGRELTRVTHDGGVMGVAFSPDGRRIATASDDKTARVWEADSGHALARVTHDGGVWGVAFSPDGRRIATASGDTVSVWEGGT